MTQITAKPDVRLVHSLPGRVRMRLSHPVADVDGLFAFVREHPGMESVEYTARTGSLLVRFDPHLLSSEEVTLRTAFGYAIDRGVRPVRLLAAPEHVAIQNSAVISGIGILTAVTLRWLNRPAGTAKSVEWLAGLATAASVLDHGWRELRGRGYFDPEVLALAYLAKALVQGNVLTASMFTWMATFGRHLVEMPSTGVLVEPVAVPSPDGPSSDGREPRYELVVAPDSDAPDRLQLGFVGLLNSVLRYAMSGGGTHGLRSFWEELRDVSRVHGEVLEGYNRQRNGIPVRFK
ncbi:MAG: hypothetical protein U9N87_14795 [Planctomycetota bacterium]|nr:hypothetical protein [Planctomycetota bacterium]